METQIKINYENDYLFCIECKKRIEIGKKYAIIYEQLYDGEILIKTYHPDCIPESEDDIYISLAE